MASGISFGYSNSGFQMGVNHGPVTNHFHMPIEERRGINPRPCDQFQAHCIFPSLENRHFTGRDFTLDQLKQKLFQQANTGKVALFGLGGIGKTQVALQLARWVQAHIPDCSIFWAPALGLESFEQACSQIAKELQIHQNSGESAMELVHRHLSSNKAGKWLFIVDNADDGALLFDKLDQYFPASNKGVTLLTTRSREVALSFAGREIVELQKMTMEEGITFLTKIVGEDSLSGQKSTIELLEELNFLPLAIAQAGYYIYRNYGTTTRYLELMHNTEKDRMRLASREFHDSTRYRRMPNAVTTTWLISYNQIKSSDPSAADLLGFMSYLEPKAIPQSILPMLDSEEEMEFAIADGRAKEAVILFEDVCAWYKSHYDEEHPSRLASQHAVARAYEFNGQIKQAMELLEHVVMVEGRTLNEEHLNRLASQHVLVGIYDSNGQIKQAVELLEHVVAVQERTLDEEHPNRLASQHTLAQAYDSNGQIKQAMELLEHVVAVRDRTLDEEHPDRLASQYTLAQAYESNGQNKQAVELLEHVVAVQERTLDEEHPDRLASEFALQDIKQSTKVEIMENMFSLSLTDIGA
ncbi:hypothetical protein N7451_002054 [Penicillium sp. IBT 35674x]|nr:hypothetical protein N7451_002054 [Penicillium sp. IBT 35674x]